MNGNKKIGWAISVFLILYGAALALLPPSTEEKWLYVCLGLGFIVTGICMVKELLTKY